MKKLFMFAAAVATLGLIMTTLPFPVCGQQKPSQSGDPWGYGSQYGRMYNPATEKTISGSVESVNFFVPFKRMARGVHLLVKTSAGDLVAVHLGPLWFIRNQSIQIQKGDEVKITGSLVSFERKPAIIAREIRKGSETLKLRNQSGVPLWSRGWRKTLP